MSNLKPNLISRRSFIQNTIASGIVISGFGLYACKNTFKESKNTIRKFHISLQEEAWIENPELLDIMKYAGITDVWMGSYLQGKWYKTPEELRKAADFLISKGFKPHVLTVPLGHPGNAIDPSDDSWSEKKKNWPNACDIEGNFYSGTSIHSQIIEDNIEANKLLEKQKFDILFLDDDFRLAKYPGKVGGCFCNRCKNEFLTKYGYNLNDWELLLTSINNKEITKIFRSWIDFICDKEYKMFTDLQMATPKMEIGIMVMYLGAEKAGIDLEKYSNVPFRIGELMFGDESFGKVKGKTDELFGALFHRRFVSPELAYSETTSYPQDALSGKNMAAKLSVSLIADVRNTMFMSGLKAFPIENWKVLAPAMKKTAKLHREIAGLKPEGPFKHYWGMNSRLLGSDKPFSLFLAAGIPFEVIDKIGDTGWVFLSNEDAKYFEDKKNENKFKNFVVRKETNIEANGFIEIEENLNDIFEFKKSIIPLLKNIPYVEEDLPVVLSWYPSVNKALVWNLSENKQRLTLMLNGKINQAITIEGLDIALVNKLN